MSKPPTPASTRTERPPTARRRILVSLVLLVVLVGLGRAAFTRLAALRKPPPEAPTEVPSIAVAVTPVVRGPYQETLVGYGVARALRATDVAAEVTATVIGIAPGLESGAVLDAGAELIRLDDRDARSALERAQAQRAEAAAHVLALEAENDGVLKKLASGRSELETARADLARVENLAGTDVLTARERDQTRRNVQVLERLVLDLEWSSVALGPRLDEARAAVESARAAVEKAQLDLDRCVVRAPWAGRVDQRLVSIGTRVAPGTALVRLVDTSNVEVPIALSASRFGEVKVGARAVLRACEDCPALHTGTVDRVAPRVDQTNRTFDVFVVLHGDPAAPAIPPGAFVVGEIDGLHHDDVIVLPRTAFVEDAVFVAESDDGGPLAHARLRTPLVMRRLADVALARGGVEDGARIIVTNLEKVADGTRIRIVETRDPSGAPQGDSR